MLELEEAGKIGRNDDVHSLQDLQGIHGPLIPPVVMEHIDDTSYLFDQIMLAADGNYLIDFSKPVTILEIQAEESIEGQETTRVIVRVEGSDDEIIFRMRQSISGRWRVLEVVTLNGDENFYP